MADNRKTILTIAAATLVLTSVLNLGIYLGTHNQRQSEPASEASAVKGGFPTSFAAIADKVDPSVVSIFTFARVNSGNAIMGGASQACASGVIMRPDGYILTNSHAVDVGSSIMIALQDERKFPAKIIGKDPFTDLAILKIDAASLPVPAFADSTKLRRGDWVIAIGDPFGLERTVSSGVVSGLHRSVDDLNNHVEMIQTDAAINVGNLGGPLINLSGQVVGINAISKKFAQSIGFAIPIDVAKDVADQIIAAGGSLARPYLGVLMLDISAVAAKQLGLPEKDGVIVRDVIMNGPGQRAGLMRNDLIRKVDGVEVNSVKAVRTIVGDRKPGSAITFTVVRNKEEEDRKVLVGTYPTGS